MIASFLCALKLGHFLKQKLYNQVITGLLGVPQKLELEFFKAFTFLVYLLACTYGNVCMQLYLYICRYLTGCYSILHKNTATAKRIWSLTSVMLCGSCEAQTWKSSSSTAAGPHADLFFALVKGARRGEGSCCFFWQIRGIAEPYHHILVGIALFLAVQKAYRKTGVWWRAGLL